MLVGSGSNGDKKQSCPDPIELTHLLSEQLQLLEKEGEYQLRRMKKSWRYPLFELAACELQSVDLAVMNNSTRIVSFFRDPDIVTIV